MKCIYFSCLVLLSSFLVGADSTFTLQFGSVVLQRDWNCKLQLPEGYLDSGKRFPVIYLLHGSGGDETGWDEGLQLLDSLIAAERIPPVIAVVPASGTSWWVDGRERFESAFIDELIPEIDAAYRTIPSRQGRIIAGYSMGGFGALRYALRYADFFGSAILLSPAIYSEQPPEGSSARSSGAFGDPFDPARWTAANYPALLNRYQGDTLPVPVYIACGDDDWNHQEGFHFNVEQQCVLLYGKLKKELQSPAELRIMDGGHSWEVWRKGFIEGLIYACSSVGKF